MRKNGGGHICGNNFFRKYAPPQKFSPQNVQIYVIFLHLKCHFFCDVNKLPNLHDYAKTSPKNSLRKHRENFFRNYAPFFIQRGGIITEMMYTMIPPPRAKLDVNSCQGIFAKDLFSHNFVDILASSDNLLLPNLRQCCYLMFREDSGRY